MTSSVNLPNHASNAAYWTRRRDELTRLANALNAGIERCREHRRILVELSDTEKIGSERWETAMTAAGRELRNARATRTRFRKQVHTMRDTMRIRPGLAADAPDGLAEELEQAIQYLGFVEAMGF